MLEPGRVDAASSKEGGMSQDHDEIIRARAYALWEEEGRPDGRAVENWLRAEDELVRSGLNGVTDEGQPVRTRSRSRSRAAA